MSPYYGLLLLVILPSGEGCSSCLDPNHPSDRYTTKHYSDSSEYLENPHRGFMIMSKSNDDSSLEKSTLDHYRQQDGVTMVQRIYVLSSYRSRSISQSFLDGISHDMEVVRSAGFTVVLRFHYADNGNDPDASKNIVLGHINQLRPIFQRYEDIITTIQAGFIGAWGEWHHSHYFGNPEWDTPGRDPVIGLMPQAITDRKAVLMALLDAAPESVQVELRTPSLKMKLIGSTPATFDEVQDGDDNARVGHHNDCFLASDSDEGTYKDKSTEYPYLERDTRYTIMGGETCKVPEHSHRHECPTATAELKKFHWTYLHEGYNRAVYSVWKQQGCYHSVHRSLGYRLAISKAILPKTVRSGDKLCFSLVFHNNGYAAPVKNLKLYFILISPSYDYYAAQVLDVDVRDWQPNYTHTVTSAVHATNIPAGTYKMFLSLSDPLRGDHSDYNVLLASQGVAYHHEGLNDLQQTVTVSGHETLSTSCPGMKSWSKPAISHYGRVFEDG